MAGQSFDIKIADKKTSAQVDNIQYQVDINTLTQRVADSVPLNGISLVELAFDKPMILEKYADNPTTDGMIFIDRLSNVTAGVGMVRQTLQNVCREPGTYGEFELVLNALVHRHFPHRGRATC